MLCLTWLTMFHIPLFMALLMMLKVLINDTSRCFCTMYIMCELCVRVVPSYTATMNVSSHQDQQIYGMNQLMHISYMSMFYIMIQPVSQKRDVTVTGDGHILHSPLSFYGLLSHSICLWDLPLYSKAFYIYQLIAEHSSSSYTTCINTSHISEMGSKLILL